MKTKWREIIAVVVALLLISLVISGFSAWDNDKPGDNQTWNTAAASIRDNWDALEVELGIDLAEAHPYYQSAFPTTKPDGSTALDVDDNGRIWIDSDDNIIYILTDYSVPTWTSASAASGVTSSDATFILQNTDEEDSDGGRQSRFVSKGEQSGGEATTLGYIEFSHDGISDDEKGKFVIKLNDGDDTNAPSKQAIGYLSTGKIDVSSSLSVLDEDDMASNDDEVLATQQSIKAYVDFGSWTNLDYVGGTLVKTEVYKVGSDGFITGYAVDGSATLKVYIEASDTTPDVMRFAARGYAVSNVAGFSCPVGKDEYWQITTSAGDAIIFWKPRGSGTCVKQ